MNSCVGGNGWAVENTGRAEAGKSEGQSNDARYGEQEGNSMVTIDGGSVHNW